MAVTASPRLGLTRWSAGSDPFRRTQLDADHAALDGNVALYRHGLFNARPASGIEGRFYYATDVGGGTLYYDNGTAWSAGIVLANDPRLADARTPTAHTHAAGDVTSGVFAPARLGTGTADGTRILYGDGTWKSPGGGTLASLGDVSLAGLATGQLLRYNGTAWANAALTAGDLPTHSHVIADLPVAASGTTSTTAVVRADDSRLSNARTPTAHSHGIGDLPVAASGASSSTAVVRADDARLANARTPTAHTHPTSDVTGLDGQVLDRIDYSPASLTYYAPTTTYADVDATNASVTFTVPASGAVTIDVEAWTQAAVYHYIGLRIGTTPVASALSHRGDEQRVRASFKLTGLTPGESVTCKLAQRVQSTSTGTGIYAGGINPYTNTGTNNTTYYAGPIVMEARAAA